MILDCNCKRNKLTGRKKEKKEQEETRDVAPWMRGE